MYSSRWFKMAALYFVVGSLLGMVMSILHKFESMPVHAHINLLGWVSMALIGGLFRLFPSMEKSKLAPVQFWLYQLGFPVFMGALFMLVNGNPAGEKVVPIGASATVIAIILTAVLVWTNVKPAADVPTPARGHVAG